MSILFTAIQSHVILAKGKIVPREGLHYQEAAPTFISR